MAAWSRAASSHPSDGAGDASGEPPTLMEELSVGGKRGGASAGDPKAAEAKAGAVKLMLVPSFRDNPENYSGEGRDQEDGHNYPPYKGTPPAGSSDRPSPEAEGSGGRDPTRGRASGALRGASKAPDAPRPTDDGTAIQLTTARQWQMEDQPTTSPGGGAVSAAGQRREASEESGGKAAEARGEILYARRPAGKPSTRRPDVATTPGAWVNAGAARPVEPRSTIRTLTSSAVKELGPDSAGLPSNNDVESTEECAISISWLSVEGSEARGTVPPAPFGSGESQAGGGSQTGSVSGPREAVQEAESRSAASFVVGRGLLGGSSGAPNSGGTFPLTLIKQSYGCPFEFD